jgi:hypothetical protein
MGRMKPTAQLHSPSYYLVPSGRNTSLSTLISNRRQPSSSLKWKTKFRIQINNRRNYSFEYLQLYGIKRQTGKQDSETTGSNHSQNLMFLISWRMKFGLLVSFPRIIEMSTF